MTVGAYDAQDRLTSYAGTSYNYSNNGSLQSKSGGWAYDYDLLGNLRTVTTPTTTVSYEVDGLNRRVQKKTAAYTQGFMYQGALHPVAELDGAGNVVSVFVYGMRQDVPDYMVRGGSTYRLVSDQLGSVRLVVAAATGAVAQRIDYDEFGNATIVMDQACALAKTCALFQPFGFAGGIFDYDAELVRLGARDYDPETGRWTQKDPSRFGGGINLYAYAHNDPANYVDPTGADGVPSWLTWLTNFLDHASNALFGPRGVAPFGPGVGEEYPREPALPPFPDDVEGCIRAYSQGTDERNTCCVQACKQYAGPTPACENFCNSQPERYPSPGCDPSIIGAPIAVPIPMPIPL